jgi:hypothetical protein
VAQLLNELVTYDSRLEYRIVLSLFVQGDLGGKVKVFVGHRIDNGEKKVRTNMHLILNDYTNTVVRIYKHINIVNFNKQREIN